ncbi:hypothetical protein F1B92_01185 [Campylobacter sp. FMV-PI01]|uniref:Uncharacterized protein n=1 Tax=Campylobacter portucalensis TaxID=2608384 RepID=A0A6L5WFZ0_9BACT|nr:hypothetical protein [Campylobacter portucalensis]MSN95819.1 hypothetical protein [Campylobacter portucalensis]
MVTKDFLISILSHCSIIHHTHGRLRVRVSSKIKDELKKINNVEKVDLNKLNQMLQEIKGIKNFKFNSLLGFITIEYDKNEYSKEFWIDIIENKKVENFISKIDEKMKEVL